MKLCRVIAIGLLAGFSANPAQAQLQLLPDKSPQCVFAGDARQICMTWKNDSDQSVTAEIRARIWQTTSATAVLWNEIAWKKLQVLPRQTVLESARFDFPPVKAKTKFMIQWLNGETMNQTTNQIFGATEVLVYPTNLLAELKSFAGKEPLGIFDPQNELKPSLKNSGVEFVDLENSGSENFSGKLAIIETTQTNAPVREISARQIKTLAQKNVAVVWIQPPRGQKLAPSFYSVMAGTNSVVIAQPDLVTDLSKNPQAQVNLIYLCQLALEPTNFPPVHFSLVSLKN